MATSRRFGIVDGVEFAFSGFGTGLLGVLGHTEIVPACIAEVVGLHFFLLAPLLEIPFLWTVGVGMTIGVPVALIVVHGGTVAVSATIGLVSGSVLLLAAVVSLVSIRSLGSRQLSNRRLRSAAGRAAPSSSLNCIWRPLTNNRWEAECLLSRS